MPSKNENRMPQWLKELQENSWEVELLISGGAIFALIQADIALLDLYWTLKTTSVFPGMNIIMLILMIALKTLTLGFVFHLLLRAIWLSFICINYVFPSGIKFEKLKLQKPYKVNTSKNPDLHEQIIKVDRASGLVVYFSILSTIVFIGFTTLFAVFLGFGKLTVLLTGADWFEHIIIPFGYLAGIYYVDFISFGILRKIPLLSYLTFPLFKLFDWLTLRFLYERSLRILITNLSKIKLVLGTISFIFLSLAITINSVYKVMHWPNAYDQRKYRNALTPNNDRRAYHYTYYRDQNKFGIIQSDIIKENYLRLFIPYRQHDDLLIDKLEDKDQYFSNQLEVAIDDSVLTDIEWFSAWQKENKNMGIVANVPIHKLVNGRHDLRLRSIFYVGSSGNPKWKNIPFWKDVMRTQ